MIFDFLKRPCKDVFVLWDTANVKQVMPKDDERKLFVLTMVVEDTPDGVQVKVKTRGAHARVCL